MPHYQCILSYVYFEWLLSNKYYPCKTSLHILIGGVCLGEGANSRPILKYLPGNHYSRLAIPEYCPTCPPHSPRPAEEEVCLGLGAVSRPLLQSPHTFSDFRLPIQAKKTPWQFLLDNTGAFYFMLCSHSRSKLQYHCNWEQLVNTAKVGFKIYFH